MSFIRRFVQQDHDLVLDTAGVALDNVFTTFASVVTAANARSGITRIKLTQSVTVTSGAYNLSRIIFVADFETAPVLTLSSTATVTGNPPRELINVSLENGKTTALWTLSTAAQMTLRGLAAIGGSGTAALVELNGNNFDLYFEDGASFATVPSGLGVINNANATTSIVYFKNNSTSTPDVNGIAVSGAGTMDLRYFPVSGNLSHVELAALFTTVTASLYTQQAYTVSPAQITATVNNYAAVGLEHTDVLRVNSDAAYDITGFDATNAGSGKFNPYKLVVNTGGFALTIKHQNAGSTAANRFITTTGTDLVLGANGGSAIVYYDNTDDRWRAFSVSVTSAGEVNTASNVGSGLGWWKDKVGVDLRFKSVLAGYGAAVTSGTDENTFAIKTAVTTLTDAATIAIDADVGPNYMVTLGGNRTLGNPTNAAVGKILEIAVAQDGTGGRTLAFDTDFIAADSTVTINTTASAVSLVRAIARNFGGGVKWYYVVTYVGDPSSGEANTASNVGTGTGLVFKQKAGVDLEFRSLLAGYGLTVTNNTNDVTLADKVTVTTLTDGATIAVDAAVGPKYEVTIAGNRTLSNPTNGVAGRWLVIGVKQDATGGRTLAFDTDFIAAGQLFQVAQAANAVSVVVAEAREFGATLKWYYTIHHGESTYQVNASTVAATGTLTATANFANTETVTTGSKTYTFQTALTNVNGNVLIGASASDSLDNLIAAINLGAGSGTLYAAATTANGSVSAAAGAGDTLVATALLSGSVGNSIATTDTATNASWGGATLSGGVGDPNYTTTGFSESTTVRVSTDTTFNLLGMVSTAAQGRKKLINVGSFNLVIKHQDTGATAANRFICPGGLDVTMLPDDAVDFEYDKTATRWRLV